MNCIAGCTHPEKELKCGGCQQVVYCSRECAAFHWKQEHQFECIEGGVKREPEDMDSPTVVKKEKKDDLEKPPTDDNVPPADAAFQNIDIDPLTETEFLQLTRNAMGINDLGIEYNKAMRRYIPDPDVPTSDLFRFVRLIKFAERQLGTKKLNLSQLKEQFKLTDLPIKAWKLREKSISMGNIYQIPVKEIALAFFKKKFNYNLKKFEYYWRRAAVPEHAQTLFKSRRDMLNGILKKLNYTFKLSTFLNDPKMVAQFKDDDEYKEVKMYMRDVKATIDVNKITRYFGTTVAVRLFSNEPEFLSNDAQDAIERIIINKRVNQFMERMDNWFKDTVPEENRNRYLWDVVDSIKEGEFLRNARYNAEESEQREFYTKLFVRIKEDHIDWIKIN